MQCERWRFSCFRVARPERQLPGGLISLGAIGPECTINIHLHHGIAQRRAAHGRPSLVVRRRGHSTAGPRCRRRTVDDLDFTYHN